MSARIVTYVHLTADDVVRALDDMEPNEIKDIIVGLSQELGDETLRGEIIETLKVDDSLKGLADFLTEAVIETAGKVGS